MILTKVPNPERNLPARFRRRVASSPDWKFLFVGDIQANKLYRARLIKGKAGPLEVFVDLDKLNLKGPDGMTIHKDGRIFLALYRSDKLLVLNPDGSRWKNPLYHGRSETETGYYSLINLAFNSSLSFWTSSL